LEIRLGGVGMCLIWEISVGILLEEAGRLLALTGAQNMRLGQYD
jgi:hypothetical protein